MRSILIYPITKLFIYKIPLIPPFLCVSKVYFFAIHKIKLGLPKQGPVSCQVEWCELFVVVNASGNHAIRAGIDEYQTAHAHGVGVCGCDFKVGAAHH